MRRKSPERERAPILKQELLERRERELWLVSLVLLALLAIGLALASWPTLQVMSANLAALPIGAVVLIALFTIYVWNKRREIAELRGFIRGLQERPQTPASEQQLQQLIEIIARSQRGYRELIDSLDQVVFTLTLRGETQVVNRRFADLVGLPITEMVNRPLDDFLAEPRRDEAERALPRFLEERSWAGTVRVQLRKTGETRYFDCQLRAIVKEGEVVGISGMAHDVTQEREAEHRFTRLFEMLQEGVYFATQEGRLIDVNPAAVRLLAYESKEELLAVNANDLYVNGEQRRELWHELGARGSFCDREITLRRRDGRLLCCLSSGNAIRDEFGRLVQCQGTLVDITERRRIERRLHEEQEFARRLVYSCPDGIAVIDPGGYFTFLSNRQSDLLGFSPEHLLGRQFSESVHPEDLPRVESAFEALMSGRIPLALEEYRVRRRDGSWRTFRTSASPLVDAEGQITAVVCSSRDVTEQLQMEQQLHQSEKLAAVGQMIAGIAHELNNPLTTILGASEILRSQAGSEATAHQAELVRQQARRAAHLVGSLLTFSGEVRLSRTRLSLNQAVRDAAEIQHESLKSHNIRLELELDPELPPVLADPVRLVQILVNLISNADQAISETRKGSCVRVRSGHTEENVWASVEDDGPGIPASVLPKIFDPFYTTKRPRGVGLGLSICLAIIREHGGSIEARSEREGGAIFTISLPVASENDSALDRVLVQGGQAPPPDQVGTTER
jgi:PAS domain S-box-containing protein